MDINEATEFAVSLPHRPGALAELAGKLAARGINNDAFMRYTRYGVTIPDVPVVAGICKLVVDREAEARRAFTEFGIPFREGRVVVLRGRNQPGTLSKALQPLADAGVNVGDGYASSLGDGPGDTSVVLSVSDLPKALLTMRSG